MSLIEIHDSETHWIPTLDTANEIHEPIMRLTTCLTRVATHKVLDKCLGLDSGLACLLLLNFWPHVPAPSPTISPLNTKLYSLKVLFRLVPPSFTCISTSARSWPEKLDPRLPSVVLCRFMTLTTPTHYRALNSQDPPTRDYSSRQKAA